MKLSQDEINALLSKGSGPTPGTLEPELSDMDKDALGEIGNISFGAASTALSSLLRQRVEITTPRVELMRVDSLQSQFSLPYVMVTVEYTQGLRGSNALAIDINDAKTIADLMLGGDGRNVTAELNELHLSAVGEAMNQMMGGAATAMSTIFHMPINISPPTVRLVDLSEAATSTAELEGWAINIAFQLRVGKLIDSQIMQIIPAQFATEMVAALQGVSQATSAMSTLESSRVDPVTPPRVEPSTSPIVAVPRASTLIQDLPVTYPGSVSTIGTQLVPNVMPAKPLQRPEFVDFATTHQSAAQPRNLALLFDVNLNVTVELGRTKRQIRDILDLAPGSILELDKLAGEPVDILVNNKRIAIGEVVVIDENFGVRVTDIVSPAERVTNLQ